jgi:hypothetical protein
MKRMTDRARRIVRAAALVSALVPAAAVVSYVGAPAAGASVNSGCTYGSSNGNTKTCISGDANFTSVSTSASVTTSGRTLQSCLHRNGTRIECTGYSYVRPGSGIGLTWIPGGSIPNGTYCALTWRKDPNGSTSEIGSSCFGVTSVG